MKKRKIIATGGLMTTLLFTGAGRSYAQTIPIVKASRQSAVPLESTDFEYDISSRPDMAEFGVQAQDEVNDSQLEESSREILMEEGFSSAQIHKIVTSAPTTNKKYSFDRFDDEL